MLPPLLSSVLFASWTLGFLISSFFFFFELCFFWDPSFLGCYSHDSNPDELRNCTSTPTHLEELEYNYIVERCTNLGSFLLPTVLPLHTPAELPSSEDLFLIPAHISAVSFFNFASDHHQLLFAHGFNFLHWPFCQVAIPSSHRKSSFSYWAF